MMAGQKNFSSDARRATRSTTRIRKHTRPIVRQQVAGEDVPALSVPQNEMVAIWVGKDDVKQMFTVHKAFLCHYAPFFQAVLNTLFIPDETPTIRYEDTSPEIFGHLVSWVYTNSIKDSSTGELPPLKHMVKLWVLGDKVLCQGLQNTAIRGLYEKGWCGNYADMKYIYGNTTVSSPLRKLFVDQIARHVTIKTLAGFLEKHVDECPPQMLADLILALKRRLLSSDAKKHAAVEDYLMVEIGDL